MPNFQIVSAMIHLGGDHNQVVFKTGLTYPELLVLRMVHGGEANVTDVVATGEVERSDSEERERLNARYSRRDVQLSSLFPGAMPLPVSDDMLPTQEEVDAGVEAAKEAKKKVRAKRTTKKAAEKKKAEEPAPVADTLPDLEDLGTK